MSVQPAEKGLYKKVELGRTSFNTHLKYLLNTLADLEIQYGAQGSIYNEEMRLDLSLQERLFNTRVDNEKILGETEKNLYLEILRLFSLKHQLYEEDKILASVLNQPSSGITIEFIAPLAGAKTTLARLLAESYESKMVNIEPYKSNPFWILQQEHPDLYGPLMSRSQTLYILASIYGGMRTRLSPGVNSSDTSTHNDGMWARTYHETRHNGKSLFADEEYGNYIRLVEMLKPLFQKPDLLVILIPDSIQHLKEGVRRRAKAEPERSGELIFAQREDETLAIQRQIVLELVDDLPQKWGLEILPLTVNPIAAFEDPRIAADLINQIRKRMDLIKV